MYYVYVLVSKKSKHVYVGYTTDLKRRFAEHNAGTGGSYTRKHRPYDLLYYEAFKAKADALKQEVFYKSGYGKEILRSKLQASLKDYQT